MSAQRLDPDDVEAIADRVADRLADRGGPVALIDAAGAAALLNVPKSWVLAEARAERIPFVPVGRYVRFDAAQLEVWWRARARGPWRSRGAAAGTARTRGTGTDPVSNGAGAP